MKEEIKLMLELKVTPKTAGFLKEIARWTTFLSILGFIGIALLVFLSILTKFVFEEALSNSPKAMFLPFDISIANVLAILYLLFAVIYIFPVMYLYKFSIKIKTALATKDEDLFTEAIEMLKSHYKFIGVFFIIMLSFKVLALIVAFF